MNAASLTGDGHRLILFVTGSAPRSQRARQNLSQALRQLGANIAATEIDLLAEPQQTLEYGVFATPALLWTGGQRAVIYGDLSDSRALGHFLDGVLAEAAQVT